MGNRTVSRADRFIYWVLGSACILFAAWIVCTLALFFLGWAGLSRPLGSTPSALRIYSFFFHDPEGGLPGKEIAAALLYGYLLYKCIQGARRCLELARHRGDAREEDGF